MESTVSSINPTMHSYDTECDKTETKRPIGSGKEDQTCFHPNQKDWGEARSDRPDVLFQYNKPESRGNRTLPDSVPVFIYKGQVVIDQESGKPLRDFPNIPKCLSSAEEGWLFEAISRQDPRISHDDFRDRMPYDVRPDTKTISMRRSRFRWKTACKSWVTRSASDKINEYLDKTVPQIYQSANSTRAWRDLKGHEIKEMKDASLGKFPERARKTNKATDEGDDSKNDRSIRTVHGGRITKNKSASKRPSRSAYATEGVVYSAPYFNSRNAPPATEHTAVASQPSEELGDRSVGHQGHRLEQARPDIEDHQIRGQVVDFRHKAPTNDWEKRAVQRALAPTRFRMAQLLQRPTPPTDESASYIEQYEALQRYYVASLGKIDSLDKPEDLKAYKDAWTECFPRKLFFDDFEMPDTLGDQI